MGTRMRSYGSVSRKTHFSSSFPGPLIVHGLPVSCPFNFPNDNLKQKLSHIGVFICYQNIDAKNKLNLHIHGIHLLNPYKTVVSHLKLHTVVNLTENEARPVGHLTFVSKRQSAVQMWRDHLQQNALNRAGGVEKAKATRQRKKRAKEKKNDIVSV